MESQLRLKQIMLAASLMLSSALQAWSPSDLLKYVPSMPSVSQFFTRSANTTTPGLTAEQIEAARTAALTNGQNNNAAISTNNPTITQTDAIVVVEDFDVDPAAGVGLPGVGGNRVQVQKKQEKTEPETKAQNTIPTVPLSSTLLSKKVVIPAAVTTGVSAAAVVATQTEAGRSAVAGFAANVWNPAYNAVTNAAASVDYAALSNRGLALVQNNQLSLGAAAATAAVAGAAYKFWPAKSKEVKMVSDIEYMSAVKAHITKLAEQDIVSLKKGDKAAAASAVVLLTSIDTEGAAVKQWVQSLNTVLVKAYAQAKEQKTLAPYRTALATVQNELRNEIQVAQQEAMLKQVRENDEGAEFNNNNQ
jgi:hypothetical protein